MKKLTRQPLKSLLMAGVCFLTIISCASQGEKSSGPAVEIKPGSYKATINTVGVGEDVKAYSMTSDVTFTFEEDNVFVYSVRAMGNAIDDVGQWEIRGDSLHIFALEKGPDSAFELVEVGEGQYEINGPNRFVLTRSDEEMTPSRN